MATIAGLASSAATALVLFLPGGAGFWTVSCVLASSALVFRGRFTALERTAIGLGIALALGAVVTSLRVAPGPGAIGGGLVPHVPAGTDHAEGSLGSGCFSPERPE